MKVFVFDICGTIYCSNTTFDFLAYTFSNSHSFQYYRRVYQSYLWKILNKIILRLFDVDVTRVIALRYLKGYEREELLRCVENYYDDFLMLRKNSAIINAIQELKERDNIRIILLSATIDVVAEVIAKRLGVQEYYSTLLEYQDGECTGKIKKDLLGKKLALVKDLGIESMISAFFTDDFSDIPVLELAIERNIVVYPKYKKRWKKIIESRKWDARFIEV